MVAEKGGRRSLKQLRQEREACLKRRSDRLTQAMLTLGLLLGAFTISAILMVDPIIGVGAPSFFSALTVFFFVDYRRQGDRLREIEAQIASERRRRRARHKAEDEGAEAE